MMPLTACARSLQDMESGHADNGTFREDDIGTLLARQMPLSDSRRNMIFSFAEFCGAASGTCRTAGIPSPTFSASADMPLTACR